MIRHQIRRSERKEEKEMKREEIIVVRKFDSINFASFLIRKIKFAS